MNRLILSVALVVGFSSAVLAGEVTEEQKAAMEKAIAEKGCKGGKFFTKGENFVVDDTECADAEYEITLDKDFKIIEMELE